MFRRFCLLSLLLMVCGLPVVAGELQPAEEGRLTHEGQPEAEVVTQQEVDQLEGCGPLESREPIAEETPWLSQDSQLQSTQDFSNGGCVSTRCTYDFICFETCAAGPPSAFCSCVEDCIIFCV